MVQPLDLIERFFVELVPVERLHRFVLKKKVDDKSMYFRVIWNSWYFK